jgi:NTP pyrophosphatase (non-canonical NTP hydrolase)
VSADREQYLLGCLAEECCEVGQVAIKGLRFGMHDMQPGQTLTNKTRLEAELGDLLGVCDMLGVVPSKATREAKAGRIERYMERSRKRGRIE